jgi:hypothetical protein
MAAVTLDIDYTSPRSRVTNLLRYILAIPHLVVAGVLLYAAQLVAVVQWFIILFTGKRNRGIFDFTNGVLNWATRAYTYTGLMYDTYPNFGFQAANEPVRYGLEYEESANRLTNLLRFIWVIPAAIIGIVLSLVGTLLIVVCWFAIIITGNQPRGMFDFLLKMHRFMANLNAYSLLLTDTYPKFA